VSALWSSLTAPLFGSVSSLEYCNLGTAKRNPGYSPTVGMSGSASERAAVVTASARSLPALIYSIDAGVLAK